LQPDLCVGKVKDPNLAGIISFKLSVIKHDDNAPIDFKKFAAWKRPPLERLEPAKIRVYIYQARDLPAADASGDSDPFITVWDTSEKVRKTDIVEDNTNPSYYQTLEIDYEVRDFNDITTYPPFILDVFDSDTGLMDSSDDFLGRAMIFAKDCKISH
jgi:Ca2+-dependent lipid-binding protein